MPTIMGGIVDNFRSGKTDAEHKEHTEQQCGKPGNAGRIRPYIGAGNCHPVSYANGRPVS